MKRFGILIIVFLGVAGCRDDSRYFCIADGPLSDRGCFLCRGEECEPQPAPERSVCMANQDCAVGEVCTSVGCVAGCEDEFDCPIGTTCGDNRLCMNPLEDDPDPMPDDSDPSTFLCQFNFECGDSRICIDGECLQTCIEGPCPGTQQCIDGTCRPCTDATCLTNCTEDAECEANEYCSSFQCVLDTRPEPFCPENDCQPGRVCVRGQCRTPCETDDECARIDTTIRFCAPVSGQDLCVRSSEVLAECQLSIDCGLGEDCVDGACTLRSDAP